MNLLISLVPLAIIMLVVGHPFSLAMVFLPVPILLTTLFSLGISLALAPLSVMFADIVPVSAAPGRRGSRHISEGAREPYGMRRRRRD